MRSASAVSVAMVFICAAIYAHLVATGSREDAIVAGAAGMGWLIVAWLSRIGEQLSELLVELRLARAERAARQPRGP